MAGSKCIEGMGLVAEDAPRQEQTQGAYEHLFAQSGKRSDRSAQSLARSARCHCQRAWAIQQPAEVAFSTWQLYPPLGKIRDEVVPAIFD